MHYLLAFFKNVIRKVLENCSKMVIPFAQYISKLAQNTK